LAWASSWLARCASSWAAVVSACRRTDSSRARAMWVSREAWVSFLRRKRGREG
jgi:hypothetical protein